MGLLFIFIILVVFFAILVAQENQEIKEQQNQAERLQTVLLDLAVMQQKLKGAEDRERSNSKRVE